MLLPPVTLYNSNETFILSHKFLLEFKKSQILTKSLEIFIKMCLPENAQKDVITKFQTQFSAKRN